MSFEITIKDDNQEVSMKLNQSPNVSDALDSVLDALNSMGYHRESLESAILEMACELDDTPTEDGDFFTDEELSDIDSDGDIDVVDGYRCECGNSSCSGQTDQEIFDINEAFKDKNLQRVECVACGLTWSSGDYTSIQCHKQHCPAGLNWTTTNSF